MILFSYYILCSYSDDTLHLLFIRHVQSAWNEFTHSQWKDKNFAALHRDSRISKGGKKQMHTIFNTFGDAILSNSKYVRLLSNAKFHFEGK